jgi:uncharacterized protein (TIGR02646 family)
MRSVTKGHPPVSALSAARAVVQEEAERSGTDVDDPWDLNFDKEPLQKALCIEQGYLCAYCGAPIEPTATGMIVEHWRPRSIDRSIQSVFDWQNLFGVCIGRYEQKTVDMQGREKVKTVKHCDQNRTKFVLLFHRPTEIPTGTIRPYKVQLRGMSPYEAGVRNEAALVRRVRDGEKFRGWLSPVDKPTCTHPELPPGPACILHDLNELNLNALKLVNARATVISDIKQKLAESNGQEHLLIPTLLRAAQKGKGKLPAFAHIQVELLRAKAQSHGLKS